MDYLNLSTTNVAVMSLLYSSFLLIITPGPNNLMLAASGLNFGIKATIPHMIGVQSGFALILFLVCLGVGQLFTLYPILQTVLTYLGSAYLFFLAYKIATAAGVGKLKQKGKPFTIIQAALFQWINPKAWVAAITFSSAFGLSAETLIIDSIATVLTLVTTGTTCAIVWTFFGAGLRRWMQDEKHLKAFNYLMAGLLSIMVIFMLLS